MRNYPISIARSVVRFHHVCILQLDTYNSKSLRQLSVTFQPRPCSIRCASNTSTAMPAMAMTALNTYVLRIPLTPSSQRYLLANFHNCKSYIQLIYYGLTTPFPFNYNINFTVGTTRCRSRETRPRTPEKRHVHKASLG